MRVISLLTAAIAVLAIITSAGPPPRPELIDVLHNGEVTQILESDDGMELIHNIVSFVLVDGAGNEIEHRAFAVLSGTDTVLHSDIVPVAGTLENAQQAMDSAGSPMFERELAESITEYDWFIYCIVSGSSPNGAPFVGPPPPPDEYLDACHSFELNGVRLWVYCPAATQLKLKLKREVTTWELVETADADLPTLNITNSGELPLGSLEYELR